VFEHYAFVQSYVDILSPYYCAVDIVSLLLDHGAPIKVKNALGWSPMSEAISYGDRQISMISSLLPYVILNV